MRGLHYTTLFLLLCVLKLAASVSARSEHPEHVSEDILVSINQTDMDNAVEVRSICRELIGTMI